jgi:hypothetical protein
MLQKVRHVRNRPFFEVRRMSTKHFNLEERKHWPVMEAYRDRKISRKQAEAQLRDLGCETWEVALYLDNNQDCDND